MTLDGNENILLYRVATSTVRNISHAAVPSLLIGVVVLVRRAEIVSVTRVVVGCSHPLER